MQKKLIERTQFVLFICYLARQMKKKTNEIRRIGFVFCIEME